MQKITELENFTLDFICNVLGGSRKITDQHGNGPGQSRGVYDCTLDCSAKKPFCFKTQIHLFLSWPQSRDPGPHRRIGGYVRWTCWNGFSHCSTMTTWGEGAMMAEEMAVGVRRGEGDTGDQNWPVLPMCLKGKLKISHHWFRCDLTKSINEGHGRGLARGLLAVTEGREGATGGTSSLPTNFPSDILPCKFPPCQLLSDRQTCFNIKRARPQLK